MLPILIRLPFLWIGSYAFCSVLGVAAALGIALLRAREAGLPRRALLSVFLPAVVLGFVGARLGSWLQSGTGGLFLYGGLLAGGAALWAGCRRRGLPPLRTADLAAPCALLGAAFGRLGCLFAGCCYGTAARTGLAYPRGSHAFHDHLARGWIDASAPASLPTVPMPLLESLALAGIAAALSVVWRRRPRPGVTLCLAGLLYPAWRFVAEFWRGDNLPWAGSGLTFSQVVSVVLLTFSAAALLRGLRPEPAAALPRAPPAGSFGLFPLALLAAAGNVTCAAPRMHRQEMAGEVVLKRGCDAEDRKREYRRVKKETEDATGDCVGDCIGSCIGDCISDCIEAHCNCDGEDGETPAAPALRAIALRPGLHEGSIDVEVRLNERMRVALRTQGTLQVLEGSAFRLLPNDFLLEAGETQIRGRGTIDFSLRDGNRVSLVRSELPRELTAHLRSLEELLGDLLRVEVDVPPDPTLRDAIRKELGDPMLRIQASARIVIDGKDQPLTLAAEGHRDDAGDVRIRWFIVR